MRNNQIKLKRIRSRFPHHLRELQAAKTIRKVIQPFSVVIIVALQEHDLLGQDLHDLLLLLKRRCHLAEKIVVIFQGLPLGHHLPLQLTDLPGMIVLQLAILLGGLPQGLDVGEQLGSNGSGIPRQPGHPTIGTLRRDLRIKQSPHQQLV
jgi:hypothetical protein